jgi:hypothetical protein
MQLGLPPVYFCGQVRNLDGYGTFIIFYFVLFTSLAHGIFCCILTCYSTPPNIYQPCFKENYNQHKAIHNLAKQILGSNDE